MLLIASQWNFAIVKHVRSHSHFGSFTKILRQVDIQSRSLSQRFTSISFIIHGKYKVANLGPGHMLVLAAVLLD